MNINTEVASKIQTTCDLRGMNSDDALISMESFLSQAIVNGIKQATIIHGHGMGTIKALVKNYLEKAGLCKQFSPGRRDEVGTGVTVVEF